MRRTLKLFAKDRESGWTFTFLLCIPYLAFLIWMHAHHEMWRDEVHAWTLARVAQGFWELITGERAYEGHPALWFWYLHVWSWFVKSAWGIQAATVVAATAAAMLFARFAPFPRYLKVLMLFSFHFGFEYTVIARNYVLGWLSVCMFCAIYHSFHVRYFAIAIVLGLMSLTSVYGLVMSICLLFYFVADQVRFSSTAPSTTPPTDWSIHIFPRTIAGLAIASVVILFCVATVEPPDPNPFSSAFSFNSVTAQAMPDMMYRVTAGFLPWRQFSRREFWTGLLTFWENTSVWPTYVGSGLLVLTLLSLHRSWRLMLAYLATVVGFLVFQQARYGGSPRHWGHYLMFFIAACWLLRTSFPRRSHWLSTALLTGIFAFQAEAFVVATILDTREVYSGSRETAAYIRQAGLQDLPIVAGPDYQTDPVIGYLGRNFQSVETDEVKETVVFHSRRRGFSAEKLMDKAVKVAREKKSPVLLISNQTLPDPPTDITRILLFTSRNGIVDDENFFVYRIQAN